MIRKRRLNRLFASGALSALVTLSACGTNTIFDYSVPKVVWNRYALRGVAREASQTAQIYRDRASTMASSSQLFDVLAYAGAMAAVAGVIFRASTPELQALVGGTAGVVATGVYYAPRTRSLAYMNGSAAMSCLSALAYQGDHLFEAAVRQQILALYAAAAATPQLQEQLKPIIDFRSHALLAISGDIDAVNSKVLKSATADSQPQDTSKLVSSLIADAQSASSLKASMTAGANAVPGQGNTKQTVPAVNNPVPDDQQQAAPAPVAGVKPAPAPAPAPVEGQQPPPPPNPNTPPPQPGAGEKALAPEAPPTQTVLVPVPTAAQVQAQIDFAGSFDANANACVAIAGS